MITIASNIEFLSSDKWRDYTAVHIRQADYEELTANIDFAIASLTMLEQMIKDVATGELVRRGWLINPDEEKLFDSVANNGDAL